MRTAQAWFSRGPSGTGAEQQKAPSSLLADWNSYAASRSGEDSGASSFGFDIESAVRTANDKVTGTFHVVSKGLRELPGSFQSATSNVPSGKALMYFGLLLASGMFFIFLAFTMFLPVMVLMPQKFALCFSLGCCLIVGSFFALRGPKNQLSHMFSKEVSFLTPYRLDCLLHRSSLVAWWAQFVSIMLHSYILSVLFSVIQVLAVTYYSISYFPEGSTGFKFLSSAFTSSIAKLFGR